MPNPIPTPNPLPDPGIYLSAKQVKEELRKQLAGKLSGSVKIYLPDQLYYCPDLAYTEELIENSMLDKKRWIAEMFDCDDFSWVLKSEFVLDAYRAGIRRAPHCFGIVHGLLPSPHAINWVLNSDGIVRFVEAQTDDIFLPRETDKNIWLLMS